MLSRTRYLRGSERGGQGLAVGMLPCPSLKKLLAAPRRFSPKHVGRVCLEVLLTDATRGELLAYSSPIGVGGVVGTVLNRFSHL